MWDDYLVAQGRFLPDPASDFYSYIPKTDQERSTEDALRRELLVNWVELFTAKPAS